jgi:hypothetical protein
MHIQKATRRAAEHHFNVEILIQVRRTFLYSQQLLNAPLQLGKVVLIHYV